MKNIETILKEYGIEVPAEQAEAFKKDVNSNYKTIAEFTKATEDRDKWKSQAETAETTLKGFEGINPEEINKEIESWKQKAENAEKEYNEKIAARDYDEALNAAMSNYKFSSNAAKNAITAKVKSEGLKLVNGKILGLDDYIETIKAEDASAFVTDAQQGAARITAKKNAGGKTMTKDEILAIADRTERQKVMAEHIDLFM